jgi:GNAT superfamily N-acetyltransferase
MEGGLVIRPAERRDSALLLRLVRELAEYERLLHEVVADEAALERSLFDRHAAEALVAELDGDPVGFAVYFHSFSTFLGVPGLYVEDVYVRPEHRGRGVGRRLFEALAHLAVERGCGRLEWSVLDWNEQARRFYASLGAEPMDGWTVHRLSGEALRALAGGARPGGGGAGRGGRARKGERPRVAQRPGP